MVWGVFKQECWRQKLNGFAGIVGVDLENSRRKFASIGLDEMLADDLLSACEKGFVEAMNEKVGEHGK